jgi:hypothetical protein
MKKDLANPLGMIPDPISGETFVLPVTKCTLERRLFFRRINEIHALLLVTKLAYDETNKIYLQHVQKLPNKENTPIKLELNTGHSMMFPAKRILDITKDGINILARQTFVMLYGSFETYLYQLLDKSFAILGVAEDEIIDRSIEILMSGKWDSKFNKMSNEFGLDFKAGELNQCFTGFELNFGGKIFINPLLFMDELAKVRHKIVHASSILDKNKLISIDIAIFHGFAGFYFLFTDFIDFLFEKRFSYPRQEVNPATA